MSLLSFRRPVLSTVVLAAVIVSTSAACDSLSLCKPTSRSAGVTILSSWCERYTQCDPKRGTVGDCVEQRLGIGQVPDETGCASTCSEDTECHRSSCDEAKIEKCKNDSFAMPCADQVSGSIVRFPNFCDSCFSN